MPEGVSIRLRRRRLEVQIINMKAGVAKQELEVLELEERIAQGNENMEASRKAIVELEAQLAQFPGA